LNRLHRTDAEDARLEELKDTLALLSGMEARNLRQIEKRFKLVDNVIAGKPLDAASLKGKPGVSAERLYINHKVSELVAKAEAEQNDNRRLHAINTFFSPEKRYDLSISPYYSSIFGHYFSFSGYNYVLRISTLTYDTLLIALGSCGMLVLFYWNLRLRIAPFNTRRRKDGPVVPPK
jgi:hypothetical protein